MRLSRTLLLSSASLPLLFAAGKKDDPMPTPPPPPAATATTPSGLTMPDQHPGRTPVPPHLNPARNFKGGTAKALPPGVAKLRPFGPLRSTKIGKGTLTADVEGLGPQSLPMNVYRRGRIVILSADRPDLGLVLVLPTLAAGRYARGAASALPPPNMRARLGAPHQAQHLQAADLEGGGALTVDVLVGQKGAASGTFEAVVSQGGGAVKKKITAGRFDLQVDSAVPGVDEVFSLDHALKLASNPRRGFPGAPAGSAPAPAPTTPVKQGADRLDR